ncbi:hypothetical protein FRC01_014046 [Tulasnella sp. 417]|nr:hypothetical protein FRC01_014046 [Tulasnella sp. 417]
MATNRPVPTFKVVLLGDSGVGKTVMFHQFRNGVYPIDPGATVGSELLVKEMEFRNRKLKLQLWDTAGQERHQSVVAPYFRRAKAAVLVYDVTQQRTLDGLNSWYEQLRTYAPVLPILVVGNKMDLLEPAGPVAGPTPVVRNGQSFATRIGAFSHQTISARETEQVKSMFDDLVCEVTEAAGFDIDRDNLLEKDAANPWALEYSIETQRDSKVIALNSAVLM